ncbi:MAG: glycosyltransferase family 39 protein, partial [Nanoarchaeota archaeon]
KSLDKILNFFLSNDSRKWLVLIIILGFVLRFLATNNITPQVADEMVHGVHAIGISNSGVINLQNQCPLWFYLTDLAYKLFGVNSFGARFLSFFFGLLTIPLLYLISKKLFNEKIALIAAFLLAISWFHIRYALIEMDEAMIFFILFAFFYFIKGIEEKQRFTLPVFILLAVAMLIKPITILFIPGFAFYFFYMLFKEKNIQKRNEIFRKNKKPLILGSIIMIISMAPILIYNYLLYREKGLSDILFERFLNLNPELYAGLQGGSGGTFTFSKFIGFAPGMIKSFWILDPLISVLGILGLFFIFTSKKKFVKFFILLNVIPFVFLVGTQPLQTHFSIFMIPLCLSASLFIITFSNKIKIIEPKKLITGILILILILNIYLMLPYLTSKSAIFKARTFAVDNIKENDIVIVDARIYRGRIAFMFHDKHYVESSLFSRIYEQTQQIKEVTNIPVEVYFIECIYDDCGWGSIANQPEFNSSVEQMVDFFKNNSQKVLTIPSGGMDDEGYKSKYFFNIYKTTLNLNPQIYQLIDSTHEWFYYPVMWKGDRYDSYELDTFWKNFLHNFGYIILWLYVVIALLTPLLLVKELCPEILKKD